MDNTKTGSFYYPWFDRRNSTVTKLVDRFAIPIKFDNER